MWEEIQVVAANVFQVIEAGLVIIVTGLATALLGKLVVKFHLQNEDTLKAGLDAAMQTAVHSAESWANAKATEVTGSEKLDEAVKVARLLLTNPAFKNLTDEQLKKFAEAAVNQYINPVADAVVVPKV